MIELLLLTYFRRALGNVFTLTHLSLRSFSENVLGSLLAPMM
jgi:hypothetical protein